jgi:hypothetical protein
MRFKLRSILLLAAVAVSLVAPVIKAQETKKEKREAAAERVVQGTVADPDGKFVNGADVQLKDIRTQAVRSFITQQNGEYHFSSLKIDNDYHLKADFNGMTSGWKTLSVFDTRKVPVVNLKLEKSEKK